MIRPRLTFPNPGLRLGPVDEFGYSKDGYRVELRGKLGSTIHQPIFTLPHGHRPKHDLTFSARSDQGPVMVTVMAEGSILVSAETGWTDLSGIVFFGDH